MFLIIQGISQFLLQSVMHRSWHSLDPIVITYTCIHGFTVNQVTVCLSVCIRNTCTLLDYVCIIMHIICLCLQHMSIYHTHTDVYWHVHFIHLLGAYLLSSVLDGHTHYSVFTSLWFCIIMHMVKVWLITYKPIIHIQLCIYISYIYQGHIWCLLYSTMYIAGTYYNFHQCYHS